MDRRTLVVRAVAAALLAAAVSAGPARGDPPAPAGLSHLLPHLQALPPAPLLQPLGDEKPQSVMKGYDRSREQALTDALLAAGLHSRLLKVGVASNGPLTAALVKLQAGDKQSGLFAGSDLEQDTARAVKIVFARLPEVGHLDLWATVPWQREFEPVHRPVFSVSVAREAVADLIDAPDDPDALLARCGKVRIEEALLDYAVDALKVPLAFGDSLAGPALDQNWLEFSAQSRTAGGLSALTSDGPVRAIVAGLGDPHSACLTIDDGPHPLVTPLILDTLRREKVKATFFVVGELVEQYPELARMIVADGHELGNHTYSHIPLSELNPRGVWAQLRGCEVAVERACGVKMRWFRPPGGDCTEETLRASDALGYTTVLWTDNAGDWNGLRSPQIVANALGGLRAGGIILMHQDDVESMKALPSIIAGARARGLLLGTVSDVVGDASILPMLPAQLLPLMRRSRIDW